MPEKWLIRTQPKHTPNSHIYRRLSWKSEADTTHTVTPTTIYIHVCRHRIVCVSIPLCAPLLIPLLLLSSFFFAVSRLFAGKRVNTNHWKSLLISTFFFFAFLHRRRCWCRIVDVSLISVAFYYFDWANNIFHRRALTLSNYSNRLDVEVLWLAFSFRCQCLYILAWWLHIHIFYTITISAGAQSSES